MSQKLIFLRRNAGKSPKGFDYDMVEVSDGLRSFTVTGACGNDVWGDIKEEDHIECDFEIAPSRMGSGVEARIKKVVKITKPK